MLHPRPRRAAISISIPTSIPASIAASIPVSITVLIAVLLSVPACRAQTTPPGSAPTSLMTREQAAALIPATVFFRGQTAPVQARNAAGLHLPGDRYLLVAAVDTSGYASNIQQTYQDYLLTEIPLRFADQTLPPGAYGIGFLADGHFTALDLGANPILTIPSARDADLRRPNPLQLLADPGTPGQYRLYSGRSFVAFTPVWRPR